MAVHARKSWARSHGQFSGSRSRTVCCQITESGSIRSCVTLSGERAPIWKRQSIQSLARLSCRRFLSDCSGKATRIQSGSVATCLRRTRKPRRSRSFFSSVLEAQGFFKTLLLRRLGSSMEAGRLTVSKLLGLDGDDVTDEEDDDVEEDEAPAQVGRPPQGASEFKNFTPEELTRLERCLELLKVGGNNDPKLDAVVGYLLGTNPATTHRWLDLGCILFSQYYDTVRWAGEELAKRSEFAGLDIGLYAGANRSGFWRDGKFQRCKREVLKGRVRAGDLKLILGTDAASEGLNLQRLGTLINIDLPWNPTRLEQRKGRIQRIGQVRNEIWIANLRYRDSVEDRVHQVLADRLEAIHGLFGQIPDTLEEVWIEVALQNEQAANQLIDRTRATRNPFDVKYSKVDEADWDTCSTVLDPMAVNEQLSKGWT